MSRRATAAAFKNLQGTSRPDRTAGATAEMPGDVIVLLPPKPAWLLKSKWAQHEWDRLGPVLLNAGLLTVGNISAFAQLCMSHGKLADAYEIGGSPSASDLAQFRMLVSEFGLTPASAAKVRAPDPTQNRGNAFAGNGRRTNR